MFHPVLPFICFQPLADSFSPFSPCTENAAVCLITRFGDLHSRSIGVPYQCNEIVLKDVPELNYFTTDRPFPRGEICSRGAQVMKSYYKDPKKTAEAIDEYDWLHSGDIGMIQADGTIKIVDRMKVR